MTEQREKEMIQNAFEGGLTGLTDDPFLTRRVLSAAQSSTGHGGRRRFFAVALAAVLLLALAATAYAVSQAVLSPRVDANQAANRALEGKYGLTTAMLGFFSRDGVYGSDEGRHRVDYFPPEGKLGDRLGKYTVWVNGGQVEKVEWSLDGKSTEGGFNAPAWGAEQLGEMVKITSKTHDMSRFDLYLKGENVDLYEGMDEEERPYNAPPEESWEDADAEIRAEAEAFRREMEEAGKPYKAQSKFTEEELIALGRQGVIQAYDLNAEQEKRLQYMDTSFFISYYSSIGLDDRPVFIMNFQSAGEGGWQAGDGVYTIMINVLDGTVEYLEYDTTLNGNG